jgi:hypothetical protein
VPAAPRGLDPGGLDPAGLDPGGAGPFDADAGGGEDVPRGDVPGGDVPTPRRSPDDDTHGDGRPPDAGPVRDAPNDATPDHPVPDPTVPDPTAADRANRVPTGPPLDRPAPGPAAPDPAASVPAAPRRRDPGRGPTEERAAVGLVVDPYQASMMVAVAAVEVLSGARQQAQLARWLLPDVYEALGRRAALVAASTPGAGLRRTAPATPIGVRAARQPGWRGSRASVGRGPAPTGGQGAVTVGVRDPAAGGEWRRASAPPGPAEGAGGAERVGGTIAANGQRAVVVVLRMARVDDDSVESSVVVQQAERVRAVAVRLVRRHGRWRAAALEIG